MARALQAETPILIGHLPPVSRLLVAIALTLAKWEAQRRSRIALNHLDARLLTDIGLNSNDQFTESKKTFWQA